MGMTPAIDVLLDARALLARPNGWVQGQRRTLQPDGSRAYCIEGAIETAAPDSGVTQKVWARVESVVHQLIPEYNDAPGRQQSEVVETIDRAIQAEWRGDPVPAQLSCSFLYQHQDSEIWAILESIPPPTSSG